ncbi:ABC transporter substrate-binding protein [Amycolatopsis sp. 3B14]|uniref:ABC transporter substrate-binding protein n=1 Tax=Amycolatopsis sp. 3B14 TaxID=3243600 RepID=UPI003D99F7D4
MRPLRIAAAALVATSALTACGGQAGTQAAEGAHIVGLIEVKGDSPNALDDYNNGAQMAVDEINAAGGVLGKPLEYTRIPASVTDPQAARTAFLRAADLKPSAIIGFPGGGSLEALTRDVDAAATPMIHISSDGKLARGAESGSEWLFSVNPDDTARATNGVALAQRLGAKRIGILATDETFGRVSADNSIKAIQATGLELGTVRYVPPTATDLTAALLDLRGSDAILSWTFPNVLALQMNQMAQNGLTTPVITGNSGPLVVANKLASGPAVASLYAVTPCAPAIGAAPKGRTFAEAYQAKHGTTPTASATQVYDAVRILAAAMQRAGTVSDHARIAQALREQEWHEGACAAVYRSDGAQFLGHQMVAESFRDTGSIVETYDVPPADERNGR